MAAHAGGSAVADAIRKIGVHADSDAGDVAAQPRAPMARVSSLVSIDGGAARVGAASVSTETDTASVKGVEEDETLARMAAACKVLLEVRRAVALTSPPSLPSPCGPSPCGKTAPGGNLGSWVLFPP